MKTGSVIKERIPPTTNEVWVPESCAFVGDIAFEAYRDFHYAARTAPLEFTVNGVKFVVSKV
jgi:hypothetical protein